MLKFTLVIISVFLCQISLAQNQFPKNYFKSPIDTTIILAGNFAELRPNHFHGGLDIKTGNKEEMPIKAVADGYVSRIKISSHGYGKVIYITHPNGFVSVYAHLKSFNESIGSYVKKQHYSQKKFEIELFPNQSEFRVKQGEIIGLSGNTGNSSGPHLHFEIRDEKTEKTINPLLFGFPVKDNVKPQLLKIILFPADKVSFVNGQNKPKEYVLTKGNLGYRISINDTIKVSGSIYFGLDGFDTESIRGGKNGLYSTELQLNSRRIFFYEMNVIGFDETRCINSFIDYEGYFKSGNLIQRSYVESNNKLGIYKEVKNKGIVEFNTDSINHIKYIVKDFFGNTSTIEFIVKSKRNNNQQPLLASKQIQSDLLRYKEGGKFATEDLQIDIPANILYDDIDFKYSNAKVAKPGYYSEVYSIHTPEVPVHDVFKISIRHLQASEKIKKNLVIARINKKGKTEFVGGEWDNGFIIANVKAFGNYVVVADSIPPTINPINISKDKNINSQKNIELKVTDNFSGIKSFEGFIDNNWILMEYEHKQNKLYYTIDTTSEYTPFDKNNKTHVFKLNVTDGAGNIKSYTTELLK